MTLMPARDWALSFYKGNFVISLVIKVSNRLAVLLPFRFLFHVSGVFFLYLDR